jgi:hypothetical protein
LDSTNQSAVSAFDINSFIFLDLLFSVISENSFPLFAVPTFLYIDLNNLPQYLKLESTDGQTVKVDFNPSSSKSSYQDLPEEERQKIKDLLFILEYMILDVPDKFAF